MKPSDRQKICPNCDGNIPIDVVICPYCASDLSTHKENIGQSPIFKKGKLQDSLSGLYTPPYGAKSSAFAANDKKKMETEMPSERVSSATATINDQEQAVSPQSAFWPLLLLSLGGNLLVLGLLQLFFSDNGVLRLEWESHYWYVYCLIALPLFFFGFKKVNQLK